MKVRKILLIFLLIIGGVIGYLVYIKFFNTSNSIAILKPQYTEFKKKPQDAGGLVIANADSLVYEQLRFKNNSKVTHHILPEPEPPIQIIYDQIKSDKVFNSIDEILEDIGFYEKQSDTHIINNKLEDDLDAMPDLVKKEQELSDSLAISSDKKEVANAEVNSITKLNVTKAPESAKKLDPNLKNRNQEGGYKLQLATAFSEAEARKEWDITKQKYAKILQDADLILRKVEGKNERIFYLVMAGTYSSLSQAKLVCSKLSARHQNCIITK